MIRRLLLTALFAGAGYAQAHELKAFASQQAKTEPGKATVYLAWGHRMPVDELFDGATLERYELVDAEGKATSLKTETLGLQANAVNLATNGLHTVVVARKPSVFTYVIGEGGEKQMKRGPKSDHSGAKIDSSMKSFQTAKAYIAVGTPSEAAPKANGLTFEIVPMSGPAKWVANKDIRFQVLLDGKPADHLEVQARSVGFKPDDAWAYSTETDKKGECTVRPTSAGTWVLKAKAKKPASGESKKLYDDESYTTTLSLEVSP